jgi:hypothetical protein
MLSTEVLESQQEAHGGNSGKAPEGTRLLKLVNEESSLLAAAEIKLHR